MVAGLPEGPRRPLSHAWGPGAVSCGTSALLHVAPPSMVIPPTGPLHVAFLEGQIGLPYVIGAVFRRKEEEVPRNFKA